jgi:uncharacterized protein with NRDE domain
MCTLTYVPGKSGRIITSNRDESVNRLGVILPTYYSCPPYTLWYPKDKEKGGTWFAIRNDGLCGVLLNGAYESFEINPIHTKSRGLVILDTFKYPKPQIKLLESNWSETAPFTLIISEKKTLTEIRWDGQQIKCETLDTGVHHIWSSVTLYSPKEAQKKKVHFEAFISELKQQPTRAQLWKYHHAEFQRIPKNSHLASHLGLQTLSITQAYLDQKKPNLRYKELHNKLVNI